MSVFRVDAVIERMLGRGALPERVVALRDHGPVKVGTVMRWSDDIRGYVVDGRDLVARAGYVRDGWGWMFGELCHMAQS